MHRPDWQAITAARKLLRLGDMATLQEIKTAYRKLSKQIHPDTAKRGPAGDSRRHGQMQELNEAYQLLLDYCSNYKFPLQPGPEEEQSAEDWWFDRFGQDPLWGKSSQND